ncbi:hypothetical protein KCU78_g4362, partial [Aureobasidium melanogenum]
MNDTMSWAQELDMAIDLYNEEQYDECIAHINGVYRDNAPLYTKLRYNILLAYCLVDWNEAENKRFYAENHYAHWCLFNPDGTYVGVEEDRTTLRNDLDELAEYLSSFRPDDWKDTQRFWTAIEAAEAEEEHAAELAEAEEEGQAELAEEEGIDDAEAEEEQQIDAAEAREEEQGVAAAEAEEEQGVAAAEAEEEHAAELAEAEEEEQAELAEAELEGADLSPHAIEALNRLFDEEYDANAQLRKKPEDAAPSETSTKVTRRRTPSTRIPAPITAASTKSPRRSKAPDRFGFGR